MPASFPSKQQLLTEWAKRTSSFFTGLRKVLRDTARRQRRCSNVDRFERSTFESHLVPAMPSWGNGSTPSSSGRFCRASVPSSRMRPVGIRATLPSSSVTSNPHVSASRDMRSVPRNLTLRRSDAASGGRCDTVLMTTVAHVVGSEKRAAVDASHMGPNACCTAKSVGGTIQAPNP